MGEGTIIFTGESNGVKYEIHQLEGFAGNSEVAMKVNGEFMTIVKFIRKRNDNVYVSAQPGPTIVIKPKPEVSLNSAVSDDEDDLMDGIVGKKK